jgi:hypothetical protein
MRQEKNKSLKGNEKFENGVLRADVCMERHSGSYNSQYRTYSEDLPEKSFGLSAVSEDRRLINDVYKLINAGFKIKPGQSLGKFIEEHKDTLKEEA